MSGFSDGSRLARHCSISGGGAVMPRARAVTPVGEGSIKELKWS
jgi:hypothetical protein